MGWLGVVAWLPRGRAGAMRWAMGSSAHCRPETGGGAMTNDRIYGPPYTPTGVPNCMPNCSSTSSSFGAPS